MFLATREQNKGYTLIVILIVIVLLLIMLRMGGFLFASPQKTLILILAAAIGVATLLNTDIALIALVFSMLLSPELEVGGVPGKEVVVRIDDILLIVVFFMWLVKIAMYKQLALLKHTPLNRAIGAYLLACTTSTAIGIMTGRIQATTSFFFLLKYAEYFMLFFLVTNNIRSKRQIKVLVAFLLITCAIICVWCHFTQVGVTWRTTAPFEGDQAEPNTLGGYLTLIFALCGGLFLYCPTGMWRFSSGLLACLIIAPHLYSLSRGSYLAITAVYLTLVILTKRLKMLLIMAFLVIIPVLGVILPSEVTDRVTQTFVPGKVYQPLGYRITLDDSAATRVESWKTILDKLRDQPFLGYGITGMGIVDAQYPRVLGETGLIGAWIFVWLIRIIFRYSLQNFRTIKDGWFRGYALGYFAGFVGMLTHSFSANTFIIVRIMEPFWFLTAITMRLPEILQSKESEGEEA